MFARTGGVLATDFDLDAPARDRLHAAGCEAAARFLEHWDYGRYLATYRRQPAPSLTRVFATST